MSFKCPNQNCGECNAEQRRQVARGALIVMGEGAPVAGGYESVVAGVFRAFGRMYVAGRS